MDKIIEQLKKLDKQIEAEPSNSYTALARGGISTALDALKWETERREKDKESAEAPAK